MPQNPNLKTSAADFARTFGILGLCTLVSYVLFWLGFTAANFIMVYIVGIVCIAMFTSGRVYCLLASVASVLLVNYLFTDPLWKFRSQPSDYVTLGVMLVATLLISSLTGSVKKQAMERERANRERARMEAAARQEQLRSNLLRSISHDLRTPLTGISGNTSLLIENSARMDEAKRQSLYAAIYDDSMWLLHLVENLLSITRMENDAVRLHIQPELLQEVFDEAMTHLDRSASEHHLTVQLDDELRMARMDAQLIVQVLVNLLNNAVKYTPPGSHIELSARAEGDRVVVSVTDDGPGVPEESRASLFEMFYTVNNARGDGQRGLGLGLALCRSIVAAHGGEIEEHNVAPHGACFRFTLPLSEVTVDEQTADSCCGG
ncbi:MAG: ATP-binding protein [Gemmiger sp.]|uniref:sensor histidine kinase n=1 Tax=Gemmiger sp. TaxID=2049027 RepID=UPI002E7A64F2|nr:ATP-binding protein [Gemmiger sp.]MEE0801064.1 ATP-binding protein [Gemmiger sp.]